jgi:hypothetical protein
MSMRVIYCLAAIAALVASSSAAQDIDPAVKQEANSAVADVNQENLSDIGAALPLDRISKQIRSAEFMSDSGDAARSLDQLRDAYANAKRFVRDTQPRSESYFEAIRQAEDAGSLYAWYLADDQQAGAADAIFRELLAIMQPYDVAKPPPALALPLASTYWLGARLASDRNDMETNVKLRGRAEVLTRDLDVFPGDFLPIARLRSNVLRYVYLLDDKTAQKQKDEACDLAIEIDEVVSDFRSLRQLIVCDLDKATVLSKQRKFDDALALLNAARTKVASAIDGDGGNAPVQLRFLLVNVELALKDLASARQDNVELARRQMAAADAFVSALKGRSYAQRNTSEIKDAYSGFKEIEFALLPEFPTKADRDAATLNHFARLADAVETSRKAFPKLIGYAVASGESLARVATFQLDAENLAEAEANSARAEAAMDDANLIAGLRQMDEIAEAECLVRNRRLRVLIALDRTDDAVAAFRKFDTSCGDWVRKYPWEFYARVYATDANNRLGNHLRSKGRLAEALPLLAYSSNWGVKDASEGLAAIYGDAASPFHDPEKSTKISNLAKAQSLKRFTVPTDFAGVKHPFHVYVSEYGEGPLCKSQAEALDPAEPCAGFAGIDDQVIWVRELRGGNVPDDVIASFQKLYTIAKDNNVSFPDLAVYALGAATRPDIAATDAQVDAIYAEMVAARFARNPDRWLDPAGLALKGYDAVSYTQGPAPVLGSAAFHALWDGALWLFKDAANRDRFIREPERFAPQYGGFSAWEIASGTISGGDPTIFAIVNDKLVVFDGADHVPAWKADAASLTAKANEKWQDLYPSTTDAASNVADMIAKRGTISELGRSGMYGRQCGEGRNEACARFLSLNYRACTQDKSIIGCSNAILFAEAVQNQTLLVSLLGNRSWLLALANKPDEAIADTQRALGIDPDQAWIRANQANGLLIKGQTGEAIATYRAERDNPGPGNQGTMCKAILGDITEMLEAKTITQDVADQVRRAIVCP